METVLSAAYSLKHETAMKKTFSSSKEAFDEAKEMGLTPGQAAKHIKETPHGRVAFYVMQPKRRNCETRWVETARF